MYNISFKAYKNKDLKKIHQMINTSAWIWNHIISLQKRYYKLYGKFINVNKLQKHIAKLRNKNPRWKELNSQSVQELCQRTDDAYKRFFKKLAKRPPKFKKAKNFNSFVLKQSGWKIKDNVLRVASLDGHRISIRKIELKNPVSDYKMVVPGKTLIEISKILSGEAESMVEISYTNNHIVFEFDNTIVVSRLIEGDYFKIDQMLSSDYDTKVRINKKEFLNCIDRATLLIKEGDKKPIIIDIQDEMMELKIKSQIGSMNEEIMISKDGKDLLIGFNPKFLIDALRVIDDEEVTLYLMNAKAPCFIKDETESYIYLILPVNFNANV